MNSKQNMLKLTRRWGIDDGIRLFPSFKAKHWELWESTHISPGVEPLEEAPDEAQGEKLCKTMHLLPEEVQLLILFTRVNW